MTQKRITPRIKKRYQFKSNREKLTNIDQSLHNILIYPFCQLVRVPFTRFFNVKSTRLPELGGGGSNKFWQCQDFDILMQPVLSSGNLVFKYSSTWYLGILAFKYPVLGYKTLCTGAVWSRLMRAATPRLEVEQIINF